jgi:hypothetical protein
VQVQLKQKAQSGRKPHTQINDECSQDQPTLGPSCSAELLCQAKTQNLPLREKSLSLWVEGV